MSVPTTLLVDLDDTLYAAAPCERAAREAVAAGLARITGTTTDRALAAFLEARDRVHDRLPTQAAGHSRLLYLSDAVQRVLGAPGLTHVPALHETYWRAYLDAMAWTPGIRALLGGFRRAGGRIAVVTDLTLDVQLRKLERLDALSLVDAVVASEECGADKPDPSILRLALERLGAPASTAIVLGDRDDRDGAAARALGLPFLDARLPPTDLAARLGLLSRG